jgi:hypothetical protein
LTISLELCGKLAIVRAILKAEGDSLLYVSSDRYNSHPKYEELDETWFTAFMQLLTENCRVDDVGARLQSIALIVFNYDRCVEHFLYHSLQTYYRVDGGKAAELMRNLEVYHPYGVVGRLPWQQNSGSIEFGAEPHTEQLLSLATQIKTFTEGTDAESSEIVAIRQRIVEAKILVFLGFAFHRLNLRLLTPNVAAFPTGIKESYDYFATAKGVSGSDCELIKEDLIKLKREKPSNGHLRNDLKCNLLLREYWRSLSLS